MFDRLRDQTDKLANPLLPGQLSRFRFTDRSQITENNPLAGGLGRNVKVKSVITGPLTCQDNPIIRADERTIERAVLLTPLT